MKIKTFFLTIAFLFLGSHVITQSIKADTNPSKKRILIGSPVRQKPAILREFLNSLKNLNTETFSADYFFVDDNTNKESNQILTIFSIGISTKCTIHKPDQIIEDKIYLADPNGHSWIPQTIWKVAAFKDFIIEHARTQNYDYLFLIDSDTLLHPNTLEQLLRADKPIICEILWTVWGSSTPISEPNVWLYDTYGQDYINYPGEHISQEEKVKRYWEWIAMLKKPGVYEIGGLGGCTLINKESLHKGVKFKRIENLTFWGEDRHFCVRARAYDIPLFVDTHYPAFHIYREEDLSGVADFKASYKK